MKKIKKTKQDLKNDTVDLVYSLANGLVFAAKAFFYFFLLCVIVGGITVYNFIPS